VLNRRSGKFTKGGQAATESFPKGMALPESLSAKKILPCKIFVF